MNIIIVGCGKVGQRLTEYLSNESEHDITVIDQKNNIVSDLVNQFDVMGICGNGTRLSTLVEAGIEEADILIAVTGSDEINLLTCLIAKKSGNCSTIARVRKPEYNEEVALFKEDLGLAMVINPELASASEIARVLRFPSAIQIDTFAKGRVEILKFRVQPGSPLDNLKVVDINQKLNCDILVCGVERGDTAVIPNGDFMFKGGDRVSIIASPQNGQRFFKTIGIKSTRIKDTTIIGGGATAYYLARMLMQSGISVKIIEQDTERCEELCRRLPKATIINGDGTDNRLLLEEGIEYADSCVALTNIDEENILLSLFVRSKTNAKIVTKINRIAYDEVISNLDLDTTVYPKNITAEHIVRFVRAKNNSMDSNIETMHFILDGKAEAMEFGIEPNSPVADIPIENLRLKSDIIIACINRNGHISIPRGKDIILAGDTVIVVTTRTGFKDIRDILE